MRKGLAILVGKLAAFAGRLLGRGSSLPGKLALRICPDLLARMTLPPRVIAITGSNGKTSTTELVVHICRQAGLSVCWNPEGSNQIEGIATMLCRCATLRGRVKAAVVVMETDEQYARHTFRQLQPTHFVVLNLLRDQLTRNGHPEYVFARIREAVSPEMHVILNADDPLVALLGAEQDKCTWFGAEALPDAAVTEGVYDDGQFCPLCGSRMQYAYRIYAHFGAYRCVHCHHARPDCDVSLTELDLDGGELWLSREVRLRTALPTLYHAYNLLAAYTTAKTIGIPSEIIIQALDGYNGQSGRTRSWDCAGKRIVLLTSKHENSASYDQSLELAVRRGGDVLVLVDAVSRKYFTGETSWLWDINFERLSSSSVERVYLAGQYVEDLRLRFSHTAIPEDKITALATLDELPQVFAGERTLYVITCFSDRDKLLSRLPRGAAERREAL